MSATPYDVTPPAAEAGDERPPRAIVLRLGQLGARLGITIVGLGLLLIGIGWNGMAGGGSQINAVTDLRAQLPWLVSGGILGLAFVIFGAALVITTAQRDNTARLERKLDELMGVLERVDAGPLQAAPQDAGDLVLAGGASFHRAECRLVEGRSDVDYLTVDEAQRRGLVACRVCRPADQPTQTVAF